MLELNFQSRAPKLVLKVDLIKKGQINLLHLNLSKLQNESRLFEPEFKPIELNHYGIMDFSFSQE